MCIRQSPFPLCHLYTPCWLLFHVCEHRFTHAPVVVEAKGNLRCYFSGTFHLPFQPGSLLNWNLLSNVGWLANQPEKSASDLGSQTHLIMPSFSVYSFPASPKHLCPGIELRSSCLHAKLFSGWGSFPSTLTDSHSGLCLTTGMPSLVMQRCKAFLL